MFLSEVAIPLLAGSCSGLLEHLFIFPIDTIKTRLQSIGRNGLFEGGVRGLYSGVSSILISAPIAHGLHFGVYEATQSHLQPLAGDSTAAHHACTVVASVCAAASHDFFSTPFDVVKQRMQMHRYRTLSSAFRGCLEEGGLAILFRSYPVTVLMNVPQSAIHWITYEIMCGALRRVAQVEVYEEPTWQYFLSGGVAGAAGAVCSNPFDVVKTRIQLSEFASGSGDSVRMRAGSLLAFVARDVYNAHGIRGFMRGVSARAIHCALAGGISMTAYETSKWLLFRCSGLSRPLRSSGSFYESAPPPAVAAVPAVAPLVAATVAAAGSAKEDYIPLTSPHQTVLPFHHGLHVPCPVT